MTDERPYERSHAWISFRARLERATPQLWSLLGQVAARCEQVARAVLPPAAAAEMHKLYLIKGARATTAIEGNTLTEEQVRDRLDGQLELPISQEYLGREVDNVLRACEDIFRRITAGEPPRLTPDWIRGANRLVLAGLEEHLEEGVVPGEVPTFSVGVGRYSGAPREDCVFLLDRLCEWLEEDAAWANLEEHLDSAIAVAVLRAVLAHLYIAWIHPFGDGNGRAARLTEFLILARAGVPSPATHLLSNHYNLTRAEYYRQLDRSSRANAGRGDALGFVVYSLQGFLDGLEEQCRYVEGIQSWLAWEHYVYWTFGQRRRSPAMNRRREVVLVLGRHAEPARKRDIPDLAPGLARLYSTKTTKTLTRDLNWLLANNLLEEDGGEYSAPVHMMQQLLPVRA
ncbi:MAG: Fic family protein [Gemmatimonadales bacterium]|nr:Fic family protein [Gemmatimonadales bacterium]MYG20294.1 Fic family protein [Gemmatimonadales bacterium]MYH10687.1 Fic family protein [Gemmatimonadales bacterium]MYL05544.1 Fic family protein [Gemmatimonadales bacterium]